MLGLPANAALVIIDVQEGMNDPRRPPRNNPAAEANIARLLAAWRATDRPRFHVRHDAREADSPFAPGQPGNAIMALVAPLPGEPIVVKQVNSAFIGTDLEARLRGAAIDTLVIVGLVANYCVESTARMAGNLGFATYVVGDATATYDRSGPEGTRYAAADIHAMSMMNLHEEFATITATDAVLASLMAPARV